MRICLDAGHGINTPGKRSPDGMREWVFNSAVANYMKAELTKYQGVEIMFAHDPTGKVDVPLKTRTDKANNWKADLYVSIHANANTGKMGDWGGIDTFVFNNVGHAVKLAAVVQKNLITATQLRNRGVKIANFHVLRETKMPAILIEHGFMDSYTDLPHLKSESYRKKCAESNVKSIVQYFGLKLKATPAPAPKPVPKPTTPTGSTNTTYKVVKGDTLWGISNKFGVTIDQIKKLNGLKSDVLVIGQTLKIRENTVTYKVVKGDTLWGVAQKVGLTVAEIKSLNGLKSDVISIGQTLKVKK